MCVHPKTKAKLRTKLKELTLRSNGWEYEKRKERLTYAIRGWVNYFRLAEMRNFLRETDEWLRSSHTYVYMEMLETSVDTLQEPTKMWHRQMAVMAVG